MSVVAGVGAGVRFGCLTAFVISETQESLEYEIVQLQNMIGCWRDSIFLTISLTVFCDTDKPTCL